MHKLKMGLIGIGHMGQYHLNVLTDLQNTHDLIGIFDVDSERAETLSKKYSVKSFSKIENLLEKCEAVTIAVPTELHYQETLKAFNYNCHVLLEKPMTRSLKEANELVETAKKSKLHLLVGHVERFNGAVSELSKIVINPLLLEARRLSPFSPRIKDVGVVLDLMIHDIDIVYNLVKSEIVGIHAYGNKVFSEHEDYASVVIKFKSGCVANITASRATQSKIRTLAITQEKNYIFLDYANQDIDIHRQASSAYLMTKDEIKYSQESFVEKVYIHKDNPLKLQHLHFRKVILNEAEPIVAEGADITILKITEDILNQLNE